MAKGGGARFAVGIHACYEALKVSSGSVTSVLVKANPSGKLEELANLAKSKKLKIKTVDDRALDKIGTGHQGIAVELSGAPTLDLDEVLGREKCLLLGLDGIEDPHNLGAILRTAWLMGVDGVLLSKHSTVGLTPAVHKVACGGVEHVPILRINKYSDIVPELKENGFWVYGLAHPSNQSLWTYKASVKSLLICGAEGTGIRQTTRSQCDEIISIPQVDSEASYNASIATALVIGETRRQLG